MGKGLGIVLELTANVVAPALIYAGLQGAWGPVPALLASSVAPMVWALVGFVRDRRVDALSLLVVAGLALSLLAMLGGGSVQWLQLREKLVTLLIALAFLGSAAIGKPLIGPLARATMARQSAQALQEFEAKRDHAAVRHTVMVMTLVWGFGLLADFAVSVVLIHMLSVQAYVVAGPVVGYGSIAALSLWTALYQRRRQRGAPLD